MPHTDGGHVKPKTPVLSGFDPGKDVTDAHRLDAITDIVLAYRPIAKSKPGVQRKRRATILKNAKTKKKGGG
jgi:hypothetical protein